LILKKYNKDEKTLRTKKIEIIEGKKGEKGRIKHILL
jgi:hypothetical protein